MTWMKKFPQERRPFFLYIMTTHILSEQGNDERECSLMRNLAYRFLSQAVREANESDGTISASSRQIQTFDDRCLLLRVYRDHGRLQEAVDILNSQNLGMRSITGADQWELTRQYLEMLEIREDWPKLFATCWQLLNGSRNPDHAQEMFGYGELGNDWKIWRTAVHANAKRNRKKFVKIHARNHLFMETDLNSDPELDGWIDSFCKPDVPNNRNARLALLLFYSVEVYETRRTQDELLYALIEYFQHYCHKFTCFFDLKNWLSNLELEGQTVLLQRAAAITQARIPTPGSSAVSIINSEKLSALTRD